MARGFDDSWRDADPSKLGANRQDTPAPASAPKRANKYKAQPTWIGGERFDSKREATRWQELQLRLAAGEIADLKRQRPYPLIVTRKSDGLQTLIATWIADFVYRDVATGALVVEDAKGVRTREYCIKKKLFEALYDVDVTEV